MSSQKIKTIIRKLSQRYPDAKTALDYQDPFHLLIATILSAQSTDKQINKLTPALFQKYPKVDDFAQAPITSIEKMIRSSGFYKNKAKNIKACSQKLLKDFNSEVPRTMDELITLPGVGRKTANVVLHEAYGIKAGICVDTHVARLSQLIGLSPHDTADKIEVDLMKITDKKNWKKITNLLINHGRTTCIARRPQCLSCPIQDECNYFKSTIN